MKKTKGLLPSRKQPMFRQFEAVPNFLVASDNPRASRVLDMMLDPAYKGI